MVVSRAASMEKGLSQSDEVLRDLCNGNGYGGPSPPGSDENQNCLGEKEEEEEEEEGGSSDRLLREGRALCQQDSVNNNEETDNRPCPRNLGSMHGEGTQQAHSRDSGVPVDGPSLCPEADTPRPLRGRATGPPRSTSAPGPSSLVASLQELEEDGDHAQLPHRLQQIAEAYFLEEDYERALQFVQLERLYHERLLSNLAALQEQWESRLNAGRQHKSRPQEWAYADLGPADLETLSRICRTHQRPSLSVEKCVSADILLTNSLICSTRTEEETSGSTLLPCCTHSSTDSAWLMEEQPAVGEVPLVQGVPDREDGASTPGHQRVPTCNSDSSPPPAVTPPAAASDSRDSVGTAREGGDTDAGPEHLHGDPLIDSSLSARAGPAVTPFEVPPSAAGPLTEEAGDWQAGTEPTEVGPVTTETGDAAGSGRGEGGGVDTGHYPPAAGGKGQPNAEGLEARERGEEEEEEDGLGADAVAVTSSTDARAKQIKVEEIAPAPGLVSILKRRASLEGAPPRPPAPPKQVPKRKVRFREPDDGADQDEAAGGSWLLLLLLCVVTMVISVGGTALYCTVGDARSSVCSDFSRNMDFCFSQLQRGVDELRHWLSPGS